jgi:hypothetical protein
MEEEETSARPKQPGGRAEGLGRADPILANSTVGSVYRHVKLPPVLLSKLSHFECWK